MLLVAVAIAYLSKRKISPINEFLTVFQYELGHKVSSLHDSELKTFVRFLFLNLKKEDINAYSMDRNELKAIAKQAASTINEELLYNASHIENLDSKISKIVEDIKMSRNSDRPMFRF